MNKSTFKRVVHTVFLIFAVTTIALPALFAQDKLILKSGETVEGTVEGLTPTGDIRFKIAAGTVPYPKANILRVELAERPEFVAGIKAMEQQNFAEAIENLKPLVDKFLGIEVEWVAEAAGALAEALAQAGKTYDSEQLSDRIIAAYPNSPFRFRGMISKAYTLVVRERYDEAIKLLNEVVEAVKPGPAPDARTMDILSYLHFVLGQAFEKKGENAKALESYLKVVTLYYLPAKRAQLAQERATELRRKNPGLVTE